MATAPQASQMGYQYPRGCDTNYVGENFVRIGDTWQADRGDRYVSVNTQIPFFGPLLEAPTFLCHVGPAYQEIMSLCPQLCLSSFLPVICAVQHE